MTCAVKPQSMWQLFENSNSLIAVYFSQRLVVLSMCSELLSVFFNSYFFCFFLDAEVLLLVVRLARYFWLLFDFLVAKIAVTTVHLTLT